MSRNLLGAFWTAKSCTGCGQDVVPYADISRGARAGAVSAICLLSLPIWFFGTQRHNSITDPLTVTPEQSMGLSAILFVVFVVLAVVVGVIAFATAKRRCPVCMMLVWGTDSYRA